MIKDGQPQMNQDWPQSTATVPANSVGLLVLHVWRKATGLRDCGQCCHCCQDATAREGKEGLEGFGSMASIIAPSDVVCMPSFNLRKNVFVPFIFLFLFFSFSATSLEGRLDWLEGSGLEGSAT